MDDRRAARRGLVFALALVLAIGVALVGAVDPTAAGRDQVAAAAAQPLNQAVIVIDDGTRRTATCVEFAEPTISGLEALRRSGATVEAQQFGQMGGAVCSVNGHGCPVSGCLTCQAPAFWNYFRAVGGSSFVRSGLGASGTKVRDGDVEGWVWGANPAGGPLPDFGRVCPSQGEVPSTAAPSGAGGTSPGQGGAAGPPTGPSGVAGPTPGAAPDGPAAPTAEPPAGDATTTTGADETTTTTADDGVDDDDEIEIVDAEELAAEAAAASAPHDGGRSGPWSALAVVVVLAVIGAAVVVVRRRRQQDPAAP